MPACMVSQREWELSKPVLTDSISVRRLHIVANAGLDIWGRQKFQPIDLSLQLSLNEPFASAANADILDNSTVNYGKLSKVLIATFDSMDHWHTLHGLILRLANAVQFAYGDANVVGLTKIDLSLPKASRSGDAAGLVVSIDQEGNTNSILYLRSLRIPAIIGVHSHERQMKQMVLVSMWIDRAAAHISNCYCEAEQIITKTVEESSFETLESLAESLASNLIKYFILAKELGSSQAEPAGVRIQVEKPNAITLAEAPIIELYRSSLPVDSYGRKIRDELGSMRPQIPFPLQGRLDEFIATCRA